MVISKHETATESPVCLHWFSVNHSGCCYTTQIIAEDTTGKGWATLKAVITLINLRASWSILQPKTAVLLQHYSVSKDVREKKEMPIKEVEVWVEVWSSELIQELFNHLRKLKEEV